MLHQATQTGTKDICTLNACVAAAGSGGTPQLQTRAMGSSGQAPHAGAAPHMASQQQQHAGHVNHMQGHNEQATVPLQTWNGQSSNVWKPAWQQKSQQGGPDRPLVADRSSGGSTGSGWKRAVREPHQNQQPSQLQNNSNVVQSADTTHADAFGSGDWGSNVMYIKTHR